MKEQRQQPRHRVELPLAIVELDGQPFQQSGRTRDVSPAGVSFLTDAALPTGCRIAYLITLSQSYPPVRIRCVGEVVRCRLCGEESSAGAYEVGVRMDRYVFEPA